MKKHPNSPHLSIIRLQALAKKWRVHADAGVASMFAVEDFIEYVRASRPSLKKPK